MDLPAQVTALLGVLIGAAVSYVSTSLTERARWRRGLSIRWDERRLTAYLEYANAVKANANIVVLMLAERGIVPANKRLSEAEGLAQLSDAESDRSLAFDGILLLGDTATIAAATDLSRHVWRMHSFARDELPVDARIWRDAFADYRRARSAFYDAARASMGVPPADIHRDSAWLAYAREFHPGTGPPPGGETRPVDPAG
ncbi:MAG TPA: hypothetical protein VES42_00685 [Pilimelia sp.]|nr:hypothetical protein [Pilimelia sp.]